MDIVWCNPGHPAEDAKSDEEVVGNPEVNEGETKSDHEELEPRGGEDLLEGPHYRILLVVLVESRVQGNGDQGLRPDTVRRPNQEAAADAGETVANEVGRQADEDLVGEGAGVRLVEILGQVLHPDDEVGVRAAPTHAGHDGDEHVLLLGEGAGIQTVAGAKQGEPPVREGPSHGHADGVREQLSHVAANVDGRLADGEKLVDKGEKDGEEQADHPGPDGGRRGGGVIEVIDNGSDLGVRTVVRDQSHVDFHFLDNSLMLLRVVKDIRIGCLV